MSRKWKWAVLFSGDNLTLEETVDFAASAEDAGAESLWTTELGRDAFVPLAGMAARCARARLGTGVAVFARPPALTEISAMSMAELTGGRFVLGLGTAPPAWNENWHGLPYRRPVRRMREYVEAIRLMWTASPEAPIEYEGEIIQVRDYRRVLAPPCAPPPIYLAAVQPAMLQLTGEVADGLLANLLNTPQYFTDIVHPTSGRDSRSAGRAHERHRDVLAQGLLGGQRPRDRPAARARADRLLFLPALLRPGARPRRLHAREAGDPRRLGQGRHRRHDRARERGHGRRPGAGRHARRRAAPARPLRGLFETVLLYCPMPFIAREESLANHHAMIEAFAD